MNNIKITATKLTLLLFLFDSRANYSFFCDGIYSAGSNIRKSAKFHNPADNLPSSV